MSEKVLVRDMKKGNQYLINGKTAVLTDITHSGDEGGIHNGHNPTFTLQFSVSNSWDDKYVSVSHEGKRKFNCFHS